MKLFKRLISVGVFVLLGCVPTLRAATITVTSLNDSGAGTLRDAIASANAGDHISFQVTGSLLLTSDEVLINKSLSIDGPGARYLTLLRSSNPTKFRILHITGGTVSISGVTITGGDGSTNNFGGGGLLVEQGAIVTVSGCAIDTCVGGTGNGGGVLNYGGTLTMNRCTISNNQATNGGGVYSDGLMGANTTLNNCTIVKNVAGTTTSVTGGGGIFMLGPNTLTLRSCTITGNTGNSADASFGGGGIYNYSGEPGIVNIDNTIVAGNTSNQLGPDVNGTFSSGGHNLIGIKEGSSGFNQLGDQTGATASPIDPNLGPLQDNGGQTLTEAPLPNSPAIDQGKASSGIVRDQRLRQRPYDNPGIGNAPGGDGSDIGAVEIVPAQTFTVLNTTDHDSGSLIDSVVQAAPGDSINFDPAVTGNINLTSKQISIGKDLTITGPGARILTVNASSAASTRVFIIDNATVQISGLTLSGGSLNTIAVASGKTTLIACTISKTGNSTGRRSAIEIDLGATLAMFRSTVSDNQGSVIGAGIFNGGAATLTNSTVADNAALTHGGGIHNTGTLTLLNCTISGNSVTATTTGDSGGGLYNSNSGNVHLENTIVAANTGNQAGPDLYGAFNSDGHDLIGIVDGSTGFTDGVNGDLVGSAASPRTANLGNLQNNGGDTDTKALGPASPAINAANDADAPARDQRRYIRPNKSDIGAFEFNGTIPVTLANISTRLLVQTGDNVLIGGFIITGTQNKKVILRAIGPSLTLPGKLADPTLELYQGNTLLELNDNWIDSPNKQAIIDSTIPPSNSLESAIVRSLAPGAYTAIVRGANNGTGIGVVEAYDLDRTVDSKLANISTRGPVQTGDNVLFAGFIVLGPDSQTVIIRALGPSTGVPGALADPTLELHDANGATLEANDNWVDSPNKQAIIDSTIPPLNNAESAIVRTLSPAQYTAIVRGVNNSTGIAVVEVYALN